MLMHSILSVQQLCIWLDQKAIVYNKLLQPGTNINAQLYKEQLIQLSLELQHKRPEYAKRHEKVNFQHDNAKPLVAKLVKETLETLCREVLTHQLTLFSLCKITSINVEPSRKFTSFFALPIHI